jgi:hypothetical protein
MYTLQRMPRRWLLAAVTAATLLTVVGTSQAATLVPVRAHAHADRIPRDRALPFNAVDSGAAVVVDTAGSVIETADTGSGRATHLGRFRLTAGEHVDLATGAITGGFYTLTAANGDTISGTYRGEALPGLTGYVVSGPITGGTRHFAGATGYLIWHGTLDPTALTFSDVVTGWVSSPGCRKADMTIRASAHLPH